MAVSVAVHLVALIAGLGYAGLLLAPSRPEQSIAVDLVTPQEVADLTKPDLTTPTEQDTLKLPEKDAVTAQQKPDEPAAAPPPPSQPPQPQETQPKPQPPEPQSKPQPDNKKQSVVSKPDIQKSQEPAPTPQMQPQTQAVIRQPEPDISLLYPTPRQFGSAPGDFDAKANAAAQIDTGTAAKFRAQLKTCSTLPAEMTADDKVVIVIRAQFQPNGRLASTPVLIEASASPKGPYLMQAAIAALQACQPFSSLPADKYQEWKLLDLRFTPQDFRRG